MNSNTTPTNTNTPAIAAKDQELLDLSRKADYWWDTLLKCARLLDVPVEDSIPQGVLEGVKRLQAEQSKSATTLSIKLQTKEHMKEATQVCNVLADIVGDDESHPLFPMMNALMDSIGAWEAADPELQAFFSEQPAPKQ